MKIQSHVQGEAQGKDAGPTYPILAKSRSSNTVVLFSSHREGTVLVVGDHHTGFPIGYRSDSWAMDVFEELFPGEEVVLEVVAIPSPKND